MAELRRDGMVQQIILPAPGDDVHPAGGNSVVQFRRPDPGAVDDRTGADIAPGCLNRPASVLKLHARGGGVQQKFHAVLRRAVGQGAGEFVRADQAGGWHVQRQQHVGADVWLQFQDFFTPDEAAVHAVCFPVVEQLDQRGPVLFLKAQHQGARHSVGHPQPVAQRAHHAGALDVQPRFLRPRLGVIPRVDDAAVGLARALADVRRPLQYGIFALILRQAVRDGAPDDPCPDDDRVVHAASFRKCLAGFWYYITRPRGAAHRTRFVTFGFSLSVLHENNANSQLLRNPLDIVITV